MRPLGDETIRVLIVEDEVEAARLVTHRLSHYPLVRFVVTHVPDLRSAFRCIEDAAFDVMVLDLGLPDADGFDTIASACGVARHLPIVVLTGVDDDEMAVRAIRAGAEDYLVKPLSDVRPVARTLRNACERHKRRIVSRASEVAA